MAKRTPDQKRDTAANKAEVAAARDARKAQERAARSEANAALRKFRHDVSRLRKLGLVSRSVDARTQKPTRYMRDKIRHNADVLSGKAQSVKIRPAKGQTAAQARAKAKADYPNLRVVGDRIIVPVRRGERVTFSAKTGIGTTRRQFGNIYRVRYVPGLSSKTLEELQQLRGPNTAFAIGFNNKFGGITYRYYSDPAELARDMARYTNYANWMDFLQIVTIIGHYGDDREGSDDDDGEL